MATRVEGVERWERSGLIAEKLARHEGYKLYQLYWCRWKLRAYGPSQPLPWSSTEAPRFLPVKWWPTPRRSWRSRSRSRCPRGGWFAFGLASISPRSSAASETSC